jgi:hypothetical protein
MIAPTTLPYWEKFPKKYFKIYKKPDKSRLIVLQAGH